MRFVWYLYYQANRFFKMGVIYKITSPSDKVYIGKTYDLRKRINAHKCTAKSGKNLILHNSIRKYGWDAHTLEVIEEVEEYLLDEREMFWIKELKTYCYENNMGMNMTKGGDGQRSTWMHRTDLREAQSKRFSGEGNPFFGRNHTEEFKKQKSKEVSEYNKANGINIPKWGVEKGRLAVIKPVLMYDKDGVFIKEFDSYTEAGKFIGVKASRVWESVSKRRSHCNHYHFRDKTDNYPLNIEIGEVFEQTVKRAIYLLDDDFDVIVEYPSSKEASDFWGIPKGSINRAALGNPLRTGHLFLYKDLYENIMREAV